MKDSSTILSIAKRTIDIESGAIANLTAQLDNEFAEATEYILNSNGRVVITGVGKSALIGAKIVATLNSTGTPAIFMHAADAIHGDLGTIQQNDVVIFFCKSCGHMWLHKRRQIDHSNNMPFTSEGKRIFIGIELKPDQVA